MGEAHSRPSPARIHYRWSDGYVLGKRVSGKGYQRHSSTWVATVAGFGWHVGTSQYLRFARSIQKLLTFKLSIRVMVKLLTGTVLSGTRVCSPRLRRLIDNSSIGDAEPDLTARRSIPILLLFLLFVCVLIVQRTVPVSLFFTPGLGEFPNVVARWSSKTGTGCRRICNTSSMRPVLSPWGERSYMITCTYRL